MVFMKGPQGLYNCYPQPITKRRDERLAKLENAAPVEVKESPRRSRGVIPHLGHLPDLNKLSEVVRHLVMGSVGLVKPILKPRKICIYTCANLKDTMMERSALMEHVYPKLRLYCMEKGYELSVVDLHWGIPEEDLNDHSFRDLCLAQLTSECSSCIKHYTVHTFTCALFYISQFFFVQVFLYIFLDQLIKVFLTGDTSSATLRQEALHDWHNEVKKMITLLRGVFSQGMKEKYLSTVMEQEIQESVLVNQESAKQCLWLCRKFTHFPSHNVPAQGKLYVTTDPDSRKRLELLQSELKERLDEIRMLRFRVKWHSSGLSTEVGEHAQYVEDLCAQVSPLLISIIDGIIEEDENKEELKTYLGIEKRLFHELMQQSLSCQALCQGFEGRQELLAKIKRYVNSDSCAPLVVHGEEGCGKTSLIAKTTERCCEWVPDYPLVVRLVGLTPASSTSEQVLRSIAEQCCALFGEHHAEAAKVPPWTLEEGNNRLESILKQHQRSLNEEQRELISRSIQECPLPLYVEVTGWAACGWTGGDTRPLLKSSLLQQINVVFDDLERSYGQVEVSHMLGYLTAAKHGLSDSEMLDILSCDEDVLEKVLLHCSPPVRRCPSLLWVQLTQRLQPFLMHTTVSGLCLLTWRYQSFREAARDRYLATPDQRTLCHTALIDYFQSKWSDGVKKPVGESETVEATDRYILHQPIKYRCSTMSKISMQGVYRHNRRKLDELPYQVLQLHGTILEEFVLNCGWVYEKLCGSDTYQVLEDISLSLANHKNIVIPCVMWQVCGRLSTLMSDPHNHETYPVIKKLYDIASSAPVPSLLPLTVCLRQPFQDENMKLGDGQIYFNAVIRARHNPHYVITLSTERGEIAVWNIFTMSPVRTLTGITQPRKLKMIDDYRCLVLCGRELRIYNFDEGVFVMKLREVMNQKMPYFGLHDKDHVVALSRSRMYVNMMNLHNGDCVATFKVGEDRFLNSLMVSENGKICVCGDETQKPSALLVWDLELRKLMYDLRIPYHEFITRLAAITKEGHYVSCVCREVDEPAPNFIVVYDLQSGTLFKKWKPGVNIISIAISSAGSCVIIGLEDSKLMAYDLITGNARWTLKGHTAPPTTIRLDNRGLQCVTYDSMGRDRSLRVWDIHTGTSLAVMTPDQAITACEISSDGKAVVMALEGRNEIVTFLLCHQSGVDGHAAPKSYGNGNNNGKVFDLSQAG
nr:NACHT domain- and WD repeat-containing protein 1-like [Cherax quadricarinatus]